MDRHHDRGFLRPSHVHHALEQLLVFHVNGPEADVSVSDRVPPCRDVVFDPASAASNVVERICCSGDVVLDEVDKGEQRAGIALR